MKSKIDFIKINGVPFEFERLSWQHEPDSVIDRADALECLKIPMSFLDERGVKPFLIWGTLLGAIREHNFIAHDYDIDIAILGKDLQALENAIPDLYHCGFKLCKYKKGVLYTFLYNEVFCDVYVIDKASFPYSFRYFSVLELFIPKRFFESFEQYDFCGVKVWIPHRATDFLEYAYGKNWRVPQKGRQGKVMPRWMIIEKSIYLIKRKIKYIRCKKLGYDDPDFF